MGISILNSLASASNSGREVLPENRQYYVATTGSDSNSGLSAGAGADYFPGSTAGSTVTGGIYE